MTSRVLILLAFVHASAAACGGDDRASNGTRSYYAHPCGRGDPVSRTCPAGEDTLELDDPSVARCSDQALSEGDSCTTEGQRCVQLPAQACSSSPTQSINSASFLTCRSEPFPSDPACPMSSAAAKQHILHLSSKARAEIAQTMLTTKLAQYEYRSPAVGDTAPQLGFVIEELGEAAYVLHSDGAHVNVYGYASAILATVQEQQRHIEKLTTEVETLQRQCGERATEAGRAH